ncbi:MAG: nucleotidyltransferase family protein [Candidatus Latescibacteria bacterium]|nr:nucleotidyltransferase family protein [Candidatus Latescibacterota bacterium]
MKALILAAGYATRLYPLTLDFPKPLLEVGGKTLLDHLVDQIREIPGIEHAVLVSNHRFVGHFDLWAAERTAQARRGGQAHRGLRFEVLDDGTTSNDDRLGAVGDIQYALTHRDVDDDLLVCAADNILQFPLKRFVQTFRGNPASHICVRAIEDVEDRKRRGIVLLDADNRVLEFEEKPEAPKSKWAVPPLYIYPKSVLPRIAEYLQQGGTSDAPGHLLEWLCQVEPVYAYEIEGSVLDIGNHESLAEARRMLVNQ